MRFYVHTDTHNATWYPLRSGNNAVRGFRENGATVSSRYFIHKMGWDGMG